MDDFNIKLWTLIFLVAKWIVVAALVTLGVWFIAWLAGPMLDQVEGVISKVQGLSISSGSQASTVALAAIAGIVVVALAKVMRRR